MGLLPPHRGDRGKASTLRSASSNRSPRTSQLSGGAATAEGATLRAPNSHRRALLFELGDRLDLSAQGHRDRKQGAAFASLPLERRLRPLSAPPPPLPGRAERSEPVLLPSARRRGPRVYRPGRNSDVGSAPPAAPSLAAQERRAASLFSLGEGGRDLELRQPGRSPGPEPPGGRRRGVDGPQPLPGVQSPRFPRGVAMPHRRRRRASTP